MVRRKVYKDLLASLACKIYCWNHVTVRRNKNRNIAVVLIGIGDNLCSKIYIRLFLLKCFDYVVALETLQFLFQILA